MSDQIKLLWEELVQKFDQLQKLNVVPHDVVHQGKLGIEILLDFPENQPHWHLLSWNTLSEKVDWYQMDNHGEMRLITGQENQLERLLRLAGLQLTQIGLQPRRPTTVKVTAVESKSVGHIKTIRDIGNKAPPEWSNCACQKWQTFGIHSVFAHFEIRALTYELMKSNC